MIKWIAAVFLSAVALNTADAKKLPDRESRTLVDDYARCIVARRPSRAAEALVRNVDNKTMLRDYTRLIDGNCLKMIPGDIVTASFPGDSYRFALADAMIRRTLASLPAPDLAAVPPLAQRALPEPPPPLAPDAGRRARVRHETALRQHGEALASAFLAGYGECVVRADPAAAKALLVTDPASPEEHARFAPVRPALESCLETGQTQQFTKVVLRGAIAVAYFRLSAAAGIVPAQP